MWSFEMPRPLVKSLAEEADARVVDRFLLGARLLMPDMEEDRVLRVMEPTELRSPFLVSEELKD